MIRGLFSYVPFAVCLLILFGMVFPCCRQLQLGTRAQAIWAMAILFCCSKFLLFKAFGGDEFIPDLPAAVIWTLDWLYSGAMILCALTLLTVCFRFRAKLWLLPFVAWSLSAWGLYSGVRAPGVREVEVAFADLPPSLDGYRIVQLADLHCSSSARRWRTQAVVDAANAQHPDLVCLTGDIADGKASVMAWHLEPIGELRAKDGVYACTGNHEYYYDYVGWTNFYSKTKNIRFLENECVFPHEGLALAGMPDEAGFRHLGIVGERGWWEAFDAATNGEFRVLLQHQPKAVLQNVRECDVRLQLSGHTHGGIAPGLRLLVELFNGGYSRGLYRASGRTKGDRYLYVSPGCGQWAGFPMRFFNDSEITLLTLRRKCGAAGGAE